MATRDFVVKSGLQVRSNVVVGTYSNNVNPISNGILVSGAVGIGTTTLAESTKFEVQGGNVKIGTNGYGVIFPDGTFQTTASTSANPGGTTGAVQYNSGTGFGGDSSKFYYDSSTVRLGIGTSDLSAATLAIKGSAPVFFNTTNNDNPEVIVGSAISSGVTLGQDSSATFGYIRQSNTGTSIIAFTNTGVGINNITAPVNALDVAGAVVIGGGISYAGTATAPSNGLLVQGSVGVGTASASNRFTVFGGNIQIDNGSSNFGILFSNGSYQNIAFNSSSAVTSFSAGTTGLTPGTGTTGDVTLAGTLNAANGGTGQSSYAVGDILYASGATALSKLAGVATGNVLLSGGVTTAPSYGKVGLTTHVSGTLPVANGGTNATATPTAGAVSYGTGTAYAFSAASATSGNVLLSGGAGAPTWGHSYSTSAIGNSLVSRDVSGNITAALGTFSSILSTGAANIAVTTASTSTTTGAIITAGGVGIAGNINVGGTINTISGVVGVGTSATAGLRSGDQLVVYTGNIDIGTTGKGLVFADGSFQTIAFNSSSAVTSFSAGTTGLTPSTGTTGDVTLAGTLNAGNGGTTDQRTMPR